MKRIYWLFLAFIEMLDYKIDLWLDRLHAKPDKDIAKDDERISVSTEEKHK